MKVYIVFEQYINEEQEILKVFSSNKKASEFSKKMEVKKLKEIKKRFNDIKSEKQNYIHLGMMLKNLRSYETNRLFKLE